MDVDVKYFSKRLFISKVKKKDEEEEEEEECKQSYIEETKKSYLRYDRLLWFLRFT